MLFNWLLILGLPFDPPPAENELQAAAKACRATWARKEGDHRKAPYYRLLIDHARDMETALASKDEVARMAKEAREVVYPAVEVALRVAAAETGTVAQRKLETVVKVAARQVERKTGIRDIDLPVQLACDRAAAAGVSIESQSAGDGAREAYERLAKPDPAKDAAFKADMQLSLYGARDLYEFACPVGCVDPRSALGADLIARAREIADGHARNDERKSTAETLAQKARQAFGTRESREAYDAYLRRRTAARVLDDLAECATLTDGVVDAALERKTLDDLRMALGRDAAQAPLVLEGFCRAQRPPLLLRSAAMPAPAATSPFASAASAETGAGGRPSTGASGSEASGPSAGAAASSTSRSSSAGAAASSSPAPAVKPQPPTVLGARVANGDLAVRVRPAPGATGFVVLTRPDRFARSLSDTHPLGLQTRCEVPLAVFERDGALVVPDARQLGCYVTVFSEYRYGGKVRFSQGANCLVKPPEAERILYRVDTRKPLFGAREVRLSFSADKNEFSLPDALVGYGIGRLPLAADDAKVVMRIPSQQVKGQLDVEVEGLPNVRDVYVRVFPEKGDANCFQLAAGSFCRVS